MAAAAILVASALGAALIRGGMWWIAFAIVVPVAVWVPWFFRNPVRAGPRAGHLLIAPADGRVVGVQSVEEPEFIRGPAVCVSIFMNVFDVHVNRYPVDGAVAWCEYRAGRFVNATLDKASEHNERMSVGLRSARGPVLVRQIAGLIARRIVTDHTPGEAVMQGQRLGIIRFGSRVDTFFPPDAAAQVAVGDRTVAGVTVIGAWAA